MLLCVIGQIHHQSLQQGNWFCWSTSLKTILLGLPIFLLLCSFAQTVFLVGGNYSNVSLIVQKMLYIYGTCGSFHENSCCNFYIILFFFFFWLNVAFKRFNNSWSNSMFFYLKEQWSVTPGKDLFGSW